MRVRRKLIPFGEQPTGSEREKVDDLEQLYKLADQMRRRFEPDWVNNCLYLAGSQWEEAAEDVRRFRKITVRPPYSKVKITSNKTYSLARQAVAAFLQNLAEQVAIPSTTDQADVDAAELGTDMLRSRYHADEEELIRFYEVLWCMVCGRVLRMTHWDPDADGVGVTGAIPGAGEIATETLNPFQFHVAPWTDNFGEPPWIILSDVRDVDEINDLYKSDVQSQEYAETTGALDNLLSNILGFARSGAPKRENAAILKRLYAAPTVKQPNGKVWTWANEKLLATSDLPEGQMPFVALNWFPIPGRLYPLPFVTPQRDLQREINITLSQLVELRNRQLRGDVAVRGGGEVTQEWAVDPDGNRTAQKVVHLDDAVQQFEFLKYDLRTTEAEKLLGVFWNDMMQTGGVHEPTTGEAPARAATATQILVLKESDVAGLSIFRWGFDHAYCKVARLKLQVAKNHYLVPRMIRVLGESGTPLKRMRAFFGAELRDTEDVRPRPRPMIPEALKAQLRQEAADKQLFDLSGTPTQIAQKVTALLELGIPGIAEEVDQLLGSLTVDDIRAAAARYTELQITAQIAELEGMLEGGGEAEGGGEMPSVPELGEAPPEPAEMVA